MLRPTVAMPVSEMEAIDNAWAGLREKLPDFHWKRDKEKTMNKVKIKPELNGVAETMLQSFYARAQYSKKKHHKFYDARAVELVEKIDYDFSKATRDSTMSSGVIARTIVFDELVQEFIDRNPDCTVVNIACGLDTRAYRMDNGRLTWYNLDLPEVISLRDQIFQESGRISTISGSAMEEAWAEAVKVRGRMLFIMEGLTMYLTSEEVGHILSIIRDHFDNAYVLMECISPMWVSRQGVEKSIQDTGAKFKWGANTFDDLGRLADGFRKVKDDNILRGMEAIAPVYRLFDRLPIAKKITQKILVFEKVENL